ELDGCPIGERIRELRWPGYKIEDDGSECQAEDQTGQPEAMISLPSLYCRCVCSHGSHSSGVSETGQDRLDLLDAKSVLVGTADWRQVLERPAVDAELRQELGGHPHREPVRNVQ